MRPTGAEASRLEPFGRCGPIDSMRPYVLFAAATFGFVGFAGCDSGVGRFAPNELRGVTLAAARRVDSAGNAAKDAAAVVEGWFGTPDAPKWPMVDGGGADLVSSENLRRAAGPQASDRDDRHTGLYREHCVRCHGIDGGGAGAAALFQNPYPRNFRHGVFKWKSTERDTKPTRDDLRRVLERGVPGSPMPSFANVSEEDREALVGYVIYLSVRGEVERGLIAAAGDELGYGDVEASPLVGTEGQGIAREVLDEIVSDWVAAEDAVVEVPSPPEEPVVDSIAKGRDLFVGQIANCAACHGADGAGGITIVDYDDWAKEVSTRAGIDPNDRDAMRPMRRLGALPPRPAVPRKLTAGVYRGGADDETLYRRLVEGIAGCPMPGVNVVDEENGRGLTSDQVWRLVRYVRSIGGVGSGGAE